ncbi:hypothetical protein [Sphingomonas sp. TWP1-3-1]|uniref:hypothetical protein n=1 Tax=Sphingomonas sp. TWP1-3-1 TaxID=2804612 RepID=UPI003CF2100B
MKQLKDHQQKAGIQLQLDLERRAHCQSPKDRNARYDGFSDLQIASSATSVASAIASRKLSMTKHCLVKQLAHWARHLKDLCLCPLCKSSAFRLDLRPFLIRKERDVHIKTCLYVDMTAMFLGDS